MMIKREVSLQRFNFWGGAAIFSSKLSPQEFDIIEETLEEMFQSETPSETEVNDIFWFDQDGIADLLGTTVEEIYARE